MSFSTTAKVSKGVLTYASGKESKSEQTKRIWQEETELGKDKQCSGLVSAVGGSVI